MESAEVWRLLERGGAWSAGECQVAGADCPRRPDSFDPLADPLATAELGGALAERLADGAFDLVAVWDGVESAVLGYVVGRALGRPVIRVFDAEGLITATAPIAVGARAVFVAPVLSDGREPRLARALLEARGASLGAAAVLVDLGESSEPAIGLVRLTPYSGPRCPTCGRGQSMAAAQAGRGPGEQYG